jgi:lipopolysaccharide export LptBFGC system permease protein LptF
VGIPLGILTARGGRVGAMLFGIAPAMLVYFPVVVGAHALAKAGKVPAWPALWAGNALLLAAAVPLLRAVGRR